METQESPDMNHLLEEALAKISEKTQTNIVEAVKHLLSLLNMHISLNNVMTLQVTIRLIDDDPKSVIAITFNNDSINFFYEKMSYNGISWIKKEAEKLLEQDQEKFKDTVINKVLKAIIKRNIGTEEYNKTLKYDTYKFVKTQNEKPSTLYGSVE